MAGKRYKNFNWGLHDGQDGTTTVPVASLAVLMDIRDELQALNNKLNCWRIQRMFRTIERLDKRAARKNPLRGKRA